MVLFNGPLSQCEVLEGIYQLYPGIWDTCLFALKKANTAFSGGGGGVRVLRLTNS